MALILTGVALILVCVVAAAPGVTANPSGKVLAFVALFLLPATAGFFGVSQHMEHSKETSFCLSCHVMEPYGRSLYRDDKAFVPASHFQNARIPRDQACYTCHTNYTIFGTVHDKLRGLKHAYKYYITTPANPIKLYEPFNNRECLHCHAGARSFEEGTTHLGMMDDIKSNKVSCVSCHDQIHDVAHLSNAKFWSVPK
jgi:cytochrome c-type protein NapC